jgi:deoxyribodipyrimidine photo-lyase
MTANRRVSHNFSLDRALEWSRELGVPLVVFEALRSGYRWASDRLHAFVIAGMADNARALGRAGVTYYPYLEDSPGAGRGLLEALAREAAVVVTDDFPSFFLPRMLEAASGKLAVRLEAVDSNGLFPLRAANKAYLRAFDFRRMLSRSLVPHLQEAPLARPFQARPLPASAALQRRLAAVAERWPKVEEAVLLAPASFLARLPIEHGIQPVSTNGGSVAGTQRLKTFVSQHLAGYGDARRHPVEEGGSGLSAYLHFGHVSVHQVLEHVLAKEGASLANVGAPRPGSDKFWNLGESAEAFLNELVTWRELCFNGAVFMPEFVSYDGLPEWARRTLQKHAADPRKGYTLEQLRAARTGDEIWNAAQRQLLEEGRIYNGLRMLWGKKVLEWAPDPRTAFEWLVELNNAYALDGRNPNSYGGISWCLGRYDRPWGPERPIFGTVRYMSSDSARRKLRLGPYLERFGNPRPAPRQQTLFASRV